MRPRLVPAPKIDSQSDDEVIRRAQKFYQTNLDAVKKNGNELNQDGLKQDGEWLQCPVSDTSGFMRYRVLESKRDHYKIEYQENGGGTLTTAAAVIEFEIEKRNIQRDGKSVTIRVLRVSSYEQK